MNIPHPFRPLRVRTAILFIFTISIVLTQIPLLNYLGYEFSVAMATCMCVVSGLLPIGSFRAEFKDMQTILSETFWKRYKENLLVHSFLLCIPLVVMTINMAAVKNCSYVEGLGFYFLVAVITTAFCIALAGLCFVMFRRARLAYCVIVLFILSHVLRLGYFTPQIYAYNFIVGYFPGLSYDEVLTITPSFVFFRIVTIIGSVCFFSLTMLLVRTTSPRDSLLTRAVEFVNRLVRGSDSMKSTFLGTAVLLIVVWIVRVDVGFESSNAAIEKKLDRFLRTEHFTIHYAAGSFTEDELDWLAAEHEFRFHQVVERLQISSPGTIISYIYPTEEVMRHFIGVGRTNIAKPWRREIHLNKGSWNGVLKHELVHVLAGEFGMPVIRAHYNIGLVEGLAMAVEWDFGNRTPHEYAASMEHFGLSQDVGRLLSLTGFALQASSVSYVLSGSFCRFLIDRYTAFRFKELYRGKSFETVYGKDVESLIREWENFLHRIPVQDDWEPHVQYYFNRKSIFAKECARHIALLNEKGGRELRTGNHARAMHFFNTSLQESWNTEAFAGLMRAAYGASEYDTIAQLMEGQLGENFSSVANLLSLYGDAQWKRGNYQSARNAYEDAVRLDLSEAHNEAATVRLAVLDDTRLRDTLQSFFVNIEPDSIKIALLDQAFEHTRNPLLHLLKAQVLYRHRDYEGARRSLDNTEDDKWQTANSQLRLLREKLNGWCAFRERNYQKARMHFWQAMNYTSNDATILRLNDAIDWCEWMVKMAHARDR
jgi:predicted negative regulator of RcsB-dependent stress response